MRTIVAPVNFSPNSVNAARYAADLALAAHADLHLYYVVQLPVSVAEFPANDYVFNEMQGAGAESLKQLWEELTKRTNAKVDIFTHMEVGTVEYKIEEFCLQKKPFVVVMGASGNTLERALSGSKLVAAIRHLPYPLIVVPENAVFRQIRKVLLACDPDDMAAGMPIQPSFLQELEDIFNASFEVVNINLHGQRGSAENVEEGIGEYLNEHPADLLLVFPKKHNFFEFHKSNAQKIAFNSTVPVMSIHA